MRHPPEPAPPVPVGALVGADAEVGLAPDTGTDVVPPPSDVGVTGAVGPGLPPLEGPSLPAQASVTRSAFGGVHTIEHPASTPAAPAS